MKQVYMETFGCQMNVADTDRMELLLFQSGYLHTPHVEEADLVLVNTCSIREKAEQKVFSLFGSLKPLKQANPHLILGVAGCLAQQEQTVLMDRIPFLDFIVGPDAVESIQQIVHRVELGEGPILWTEFDSQKNYSIPEQPLIKEPSPSAFVNIIKGCDKFCSFCVVPFTRGREKSREAGEIYAEIRQLVDKGAKEIVLLGQNVNAYGKRGLDQPVAFHELLYGIAEIPGVERLRFTTSHPMDFTHELVEAYRDIDILMNHLHLPVQSGSNRILELMRRSHTTEWYMDLIAQLKSEVPDIALSTDIIVGFPGETRQDFESTLKLMEQVRFNSSYMFSYSPRPNTPALEMVDDIPHEEKQERLQQTIQLQNRLTEENSQAFLGQDVEVLIESVTSRKGMSFRGRSSHYWSVAFKGGEDCLKPGDVTHVRVEEVSGQVLRGNWAANRHR
jgi:tRNA-2-methylthio-N6-dimethylallyladenosine synthase